MTFVNKMDREARDPFELLDEISDQLQLECAPMVWPAGMGLNFKGAIDLYTEQFCAFGSTEKLGGNASRRCSARGKGTSWTKMSSWRAPACRASIPPPIARAI